MVNKQLCLAECESKVLGFQTSVKDNQRLAACDTKCQRINTLMSDVRCYNNKF